MKKMYYLSSCKTCQKIINKLNAEQGFELQDIKTKRITPEQLDFMKEKVGSYETLFSRIARKYRSMELHRRQLSEQDYRNLILEEYTFLKRPVIIIDDAIFVGNAKKTIEAVKEKMEVPG